MEQSGQMPLDLGGKPAFTVADFLVAESNREAFAHVQRWPAWPAFATALTGPAGSGKSHLAHVFAARADGPVLTAAALRFELVPGLALAPAVAVEDADRGGDEAALLHLFNLLRERGRGLLLTGREAPTRWPVALADLRSRLAALPAVAIGAPDEGLLGALMVKLFADRQLRVGQDVLAYLLPRVERSFAAVHAAVEALDDAALAQGRPITVPLARAALGFGVTPDRPDE